MGAKTVRYHVRFDPDDGVWYGQRGEEDTWAMYASYDGRGNGIGDPIPTSVEAPDTKAGKQEVIEVVRDFARWERNRSGGGTGRGHGCVVVIHNKGGGTRTIRIPRITQCSLAPFR